MQSIIKFSCMAAVATAAPCPQPPTNDTVSIPQYMGRWFEIATNNKFRQSTEKGLHCNNANYTLSSDGTVKVVNTGNKGSPTGTTSEAVGKAQQVSGGKLKVSFFGPFYGPYWIIDLTGSETEGYETALIYSCSSGLLSVEDMWILSRKPQMSQQQINNFYSVAEGYGINVKNLNMTLTDQSSTCVYPN